MDVAKVIALLERAHHEHRDGGIEGLTSCPGNSYERIDKDYPGQWGYVDRPEMCDCGASAINAEIDQLISELKQEALAWNAE